MVTYADSPFDSMEIRILKLIEESQDQRVTGIAQAIGIDFDVAYGYCLLLSDEGLIEELHDGNVPIKYAYSSVEQVGFHLTAKGHQGWETFGKEKAILASSSLLASREPHVGL